MLRIRVDPWLRPHSGSAEGLSADSQDLRRFRLRPNHLCYLRHLWTLSGPLRSGWIGRKKAHPPPSRPARSCKKRKIGWPDFRLNYSARNDSVISVRAGVGAAPSSAYAFRINSRFIHSLRLCDLSEPGERARDHPEPDLNLCKSQESVDKHPDFPARARQIRQNHLRQNPSLGSRRLFLPDSGGIPRVLRLGAVKRIPQIVHKQGRVVRLDLDPAHFGNA